MKQKKPEASTTAKKPVTRTLSEIRRAAAYKSVAVRRLNPKPRVQRSSMSCRLSDAERMRAVAADCGITVLDAITRVLDVYAKEQKRKREVHTT